MGIWSMTWKLECVNRDVQSHAIVKAQMWVDIQSGTRISEGVRMCILSLTDRCEGFAWISRSEGFDVDI